MTRLRPHTRLLLVLMCVLTLSVRVSDAHMHLCLDGSEPSVALHIHADVDDHHHQVDATHSDVDLRLADHPLLKKAGVDGDPSAIMPPAYLLSRLSRGAAAIDLPEPTVSTFSSAHYLRPPLRGPPV